MKAKLAALDQNHTWDIDCPSAVKPIGCKWIYSTTLKYNGSLIDTKLDLWYMEIGKNIALTTRRCFVTAPDRDPILIRRRGAAGQKIPPHTR